MDMVVHHRVSQAIHGKNTGEKLQALPNPISSVLEGFSGHRVFATQKGPPDTALDTVHDLNFSGINDFTTSRPGDGNDSKEVGVRCRRKNLPPSETGNKTHDCLSLLAVHLKPLIPTGSAIRVGHLLCVHDGQ